MIKINTTEASLTPREKEIMEWLSRGLTYKLIAKNLSVSPETVKMHLKKVYRKLQVKNKVEAINFLRNSH